MDGIDELKAKLLRLEAEVAYLRGRLGEVADEAGDAAEAGSFRIEDAPAGPPTETEDEVEVDSRVLDGSTPSGGSQRREDRSLEWAAGEIAVLRLYGWSGSTTIAYPVLQDDEESSGTTARLDKIHFLVRVPVDPSNPAKGSILKYAKLGRVPAETCEESSGSSGT